MAATKKCLLGSLSIMKRLLPIIEWLPKYRLKEYFLRDLFGGFTLACIHVPQALAFAMLADVDLVLGLYTSCFSGFIYTLLGTSNISSYGPVAVGSMLTGDGVIKAKSYGFERNEAASALTFLIGIMYFVGFLLGLGIVTRVYRKNFISPFVCGCTIHIIAKSLKLLLGLKVNTEYGIFNCPKNLYNFFKNIHLTNYWTLGISVIVLIIFSLNTLVLKPFIRKYTLVIIPIEGITMMLATLASYLLDFKGKGVPIVGYIPSGVPKPLFPNWSILPVLPTPAVATAMINFSSSISMCILFNPDVRPGQELFAMAISNLICSNFQCIPIGNSMMRTTVAATLGVKTLIATFTCSLFLMIIIFFGGAVFEPMPRAVLGCIVALSSYLLLLDRLKEVLPLCQKSFKNSVMYITILSTTVFADMIYGLLAGFILSLSLVLQEIPDEKMLKGSEADIEVEEDEEMAKKRLLKKSREFSYQ